MGIPVDKFADTITAEFETYSKEVTEGTKKVIDSVTAKAVMELRATSPRRTGGGLRRRRFSPGAYARSWTHKPTYENTRTKRNTVFNRGHFRLSHLLEHGHARRGGGRVSAQPHIRPVEQNAIKKLEEGIERAAKNA